MTFTAYLSSTSGPKFAPHFDDLMKETTTPDYMTSLIPMFEVASAALANLNDSSTIDEIHTVGHKLHDMMVDFELLYKEFRTQACHNEHCRESFMVVRNYIGNLAYDLERYSE